MARDLIIKTWCDYCLDRNEELVEAEETVVATGAPGTALKPLLIALCEEHLTHLSGVLALVAELGVPVDEKGEPVTSRRSPATPAKTKTTKHRAPSTVRWSDPNVPEPERTCSECGTVSKTLQGLAGHVRKYHGTTLAEQNGEELPHGCPECGQRFSRPQAVGTHRRAKHGVAGTSEGSVQAGEARAARRNQGGRQVA